jgi:hypothetical protein
MRAFHLPLWLQALRASVEESKHAISKTSMELVAVLTDTQATEELLA